MLVDQKMPIPDRLDRVSNALSGIENEIRNCYDESAPGVRYVVRPGSALAPEGIIRRGTFLGCGEIEELVVDEGIVAMEKVNYSGMRITLDMTTARPTLKWRDYAWLNKKQRGLSGFLRDRHSLMKEWLYERWKGPLAFLLENISNANIPKKAIVDWFPEVARSPIGGCNRLLWELFLGGNEGGDHWLYWNREHTPEEMREFVANCERASRPLIRLGADPNMKGAPLHFSWNDIMEG